MVGKATIGHPLAPTLHLVVEKTAPSAHQDLSLCAASDKQKLRLT